MTRLHVGSLGHHFTSGSTTCGVMGFTIAPPVLPHVGSWGSPLHPGFYHTWGHGVHHCTSASCGAIGSPFHLGFSHMWGHGVHHYTSGSTTYMFDHGVHHCISASCGVIGSPFHLGIYHMWGHGVHQSSMVLVIVTSPHCTNNKLAPVIYGSCYCDVATLYKQQVGSRHLWFLLL